MFCQDADCSIEACQRVFWDSGNWPSLLRDFGIFGILIQGYGILRYFGILDIHFGKYQIWDLRY